MQRCTETPLRLLRYARYATYQTSDEPEADAGARGSQFEFCGLASDVFTQSDPPFFDVATAGSVAALDGRVSTLENNVAELQTAIRKSYEGTAIAIALGGAALPDNKQYAISGNFGAFRGESAFGGVFQYRVSDNLVLNGGAGVGFGYGGVGGRGGATFAWQFGSGFVQSPYSRPR